MQGFSLHDAARCEAHYRQGLLRGSLFGVVNVGRGSRPIPAAGNWQQPVEFGDHAHMFLQIAFRRRILILDCPGDDPEVA
jgi:hypothetical protein